jgi:hypothetical protein
MPSNLAKLAISSRLRRETTLTQPWILARLHDGTWKRLTAKLHSWRKINEFPEIPAFGGTAFLSILGGFGKFSPLCLVMCRR